MVFGRGVGLVTLPDRRHRVHAFTRRWTPFVTARTVCRFGLNRRLVTLWAWLIRLPNIGPLPQTSHRIAKANLQGPTGKQQF